jgi:ABC-type dipeptide/oligopeptide/nickel transport system permease component
MYSIPWYVCGMYMLCMACMVYHGYVYGISWLCIWLCILLCILLCICMGVHNTSIYDCVLEITVVEMCPLPIPHMKKMVHFLYSFSFFHFPLCMLHRIHTIYNLYVHLFMLHCACCIVYIPHIIDMFNVHYA